VRHRCGELSAFGFAGKQRRQHFGRGLDLPERLNQAVLAFPPSTAFSYWMIVSFSCSRSALTAIRRRAISVAAANSVWMNES